MTTHAAHPRRRTPLFLFKLLALGLLVFSVVLVLRFLGQLGPSPGTGGMLVAVGFVAFMGLLLFLVPSGQLEKVVLGLTLGIAIVPPVLLLLAMLPELRREHERAQEREAVVQRVTAPGQKKELADFLLELGDRVSLYGEPLTVSQVQRLGQALQGLSPQDLREQHMAENFLLGQELDLNPVNTTSASQDALYRLYPPLKQRQGFSPEAEPFYLRALDRMVSRAAQLGRDAWLAQVGQEHAAFLEVAQRGGFNSMQFHDRFHEPVAPGTHVVSSSLGSLPFYVLMRVSTSTFPPPSPRSAEQTQTRLMHRQNALKELHQSLEAMDSRGLRFTEEELREPGLKAYLEEIRATPSQSVPERDTP